MESVDNNQFEIKSMKTKRKIVAPCSNTYLNPGLDILLNEDPMCNTAMEIAPNKKRKRTRSCSDIAAFENSALDLGTNKVVNQCLVRELENVKKNVRLNNTGEIHKNIESDEPVYANLTDINSLTENNSINLTLDTPAIKDYKITKNVCNVNSPTSAVSYNDTINTPIPHEHMDSGISVLEQKLYNNIDDKINALSPITNIQKNVTNQVFINNVNNTSNLNLSFLDRLGLDSPNLSNQSLFYDDDLNESNIMEIKTITIITKKKRIGNKNTNPFLDPNIVNIEQNDSVQNPFLNSNITKPELEYTEEVLKRPPIASVPTVNIIEPRRLFGDTNSTISTVNESLDDPHIYENIDHYRSESPIYEHIEEANDVNKQSRILGHDVSRFSAIDIMNLNKMSQQDNCNDSNDSKSSKNKSSFMKVGNKLSKKVFKTLKKTFKADKTENNVSLNPYEVPRKPPKQKTAPKESGIENPGLHLDNSDEIEIEEIDDEHEYETVKTLRNTHLNTNITPLKERTDNADISHNKSNTPGKKVRFDSTLNQEKVITGNSFDYDIQSPGFDSKLDKYHDELENCINERKFLQQNM